MRLTDDEAARRLSAHDHGVLCTLHPARGADAVPVVYAVVDDTVTIPIDLVKPKSSTRLQRHRNLETDPRATLLIDHWNRDDWSQLWWVRAELQWNGPDSLEPTEPASTLLAERYAQYRDRPFAAVLELRIAGLTGWSGDDSDRTTAPS
ncbi:MAG: pyridoxamine 5'-phosphate oxidase family protein [Ilumatobacter sp.]